MLGALGAYPGSPAVNVSGTNKNRPYQEARSNFERAGDENRARVLCLGIGPSQNADLHVNGCLASLTAISKDPRVTTRDRDLPQLRARSRTDRSRKWTDLEFGDDDKNQTVEPEFQAHSTPSA